MANSRCILAAGVAGLLASASAAPTPAAHPAAQPYGVQEHELQELSLLAPHLHDLVVRSAIAPEALAEELRASPLAAIADEVAVLTSEARAAVVPAANALPLIVTHGMGDSCFNSGMKSITQRSGERLGVNSTCIPTGDNKISDTIDGFLMNMDKSVDVFAEKVRADPKLAGGFDAFGLSQGNNVIRGYMAKYNDPPVRTYMSICGINGGVAAFPQCSPAGKLLGKPCQALTEVLGALAYNPIVQKVLFQANYFRDPTRVNSTGYQKNSQLAHWNGENPAATDMDERKANYAKTSKFVWVRGTKDTEVWPNEAEQWGAPPDDYPAHLAALPMTQTRWYTTDAFGLRTADEAGKNFFEEYDGNHIRFTEAELDGWLDKYFKQ